MEDNLNLISSATKLMALFNAGKEALPSETVPLSSALTLFDGEAEVREKALADMEHTRHLQKPHAAPAFAPELNFGRVGWRRSSSEKDVRPASEGSRRSVAAGSRRHMSLASTKLRMSVATFNETLKQDEDLERLKAYETKRLSREARAHKDSMASTRQSLASP